MTKKTETKTTKRPYCKPQLEQVGLVAEEAVLQNCKFVVGANPLKKNNKCVAGVMCYTHGS